MVETPVFGANPVTTVFARPETGRAAEHSAGKLKVFRPCFYVLKRKMRTRRFELPRDYLPLGPQPSASANSATSAD